MRETPSEANVRVHDDSLSLRYDGGGGRGGDRMGQSTKNVRWLRGEMKTRNGS